MKKRVKIYALILLALCLAVPSVNAISLDIYPANNVNNPQVINLGDITSLSLSVSLNDNSPVPLQNKQIVYQSEPLGTSAVIQLPADLNRVAISAGGRSIDPNNPFVTTRYYELVYSYAEPTPEPTAPYITASVYNTGENNLFYDYNVRCMPDEGFFFAPLSFYSYGGQIPQCDLTSLQTLIQVRVWAGEDIPIYSCALSGSGGVPNFQYIQTVLSAPVYSAGTVINVTTVKDKLQDISNPVHPSQNNPVISGDFQPIGKDTIINSPFGNLVTNGGLIFSLPHMEDPHQLRENLLNGTQNLTAPLYDAVDSVTGAVLFVPSVISGALSSVVSPLLDTVDLLKSVFDSLFEVINNSMNFIYYLLPTVYLLIPDAVWWCIIAVLCYFIFKWILIFVFGNDVINAYFEKGGKE